MASNITKIHFSDLCKSIIDEYNNFLDDEVDKLEIFTPMVNLIALVWNLASSSKNFEEAENGLQSLVFNCDVEKEIELMQDILRKKWKNYRYDKNLILHVKLEEQDNEYKVYSYLVDEKEYDCPEAQSIYDKINSTDFQAKLAGLSTPEKNKEISKFLLEYFDPTRDIEEVYIIKNEDNPLDKFRVYSCPCGCGNSYKTFSLREIETAYEKAKKDLDYESVLERSSGVIEGSFDKEYFNNFEEYFILADVIVLLGERWYVNYNKEKDLFKKAIRDATSLCNKYQDEEQFNKALFKEPEYELLNFINSKISKYKDKDPDYLNMLNKLFTLALYNFFLKIKSEGFGVN